MKKWQIALLIGVVVVFGLWFLKVFPDPYHREGNVNFFVWVYREVDELIHGERG